MRFRSTQKDNQSFAGPRELITALGQDLVAAKADDVDVLAPDLFLKAQTAYLKARKVLDTGGVPADVQGYVAKSRESLDQAITKARTARKILAETNEAREKAIVAGAQNLGQPFEEVEAQYNRLTDAIKNNDIGYAQDNNQRIQNRYHEVEILAIKHNALEADPASDG